MTSHPHTPPDASSPIPDDMAEAIAAYALDALPPDECVRVEAYLQAHAGAQQLLDEYRAVVNLLPYAANVQAPPVALRAETLRQARVMRARRTPARLVALRGSRVFAAVAACLLFAVLLWNIALPGGQGGMGGTGGVASPTSEIARLLNTPGLITYEMAPGPAAPAASGHIYLTPDRTRTALVVQGVPPTPPGQTYQLWFRRGDQGRVSVTTFAVDATGTAVLVLPLPPADVPYISCGITVEPAGGSPAPTGQRVLATGVWPTM